MEPRKHVDFVGALIFMVLSIYVIVSGSNYYHAIQIRGEIPFYESPGFLPILAGIAMLICSVLLLARSLKNGALFENLQKIKTGCGLLLKSPVMFKVLIGCLWMGVYIFVLLQSLGFATSSVLFLVVFMAFLQLEKLRASSKQGIMLLFAKYFGVSAASVGFTYVLFQIVFRVPLP